MILTPKDLNFDFEQLKESIDYVITSDLMYERYFMKQEANPQSTRFYEWLFSVGELSHEEKPRYETYIIHNPTLKLYKIRHRNN